MPLSKRSLLYIDKSKNLNSHRKAQAEHSGRTVKLKMTAETMFEARKEGIQASSKQWCPLHSDDRRALKYHDKKIQSNTNLDAKRRRSSV